MNWHQPQPQGNHNHNHDHNHGHDHSYHHHHNQQSAGNMFSSSLISTSTSTPTSTSTLTSLLSSITTTPAFLVPPPPSLEPPAPYEWNISAHSLSISQVLHPEEADEDPLLVETEWNKLIADDPKDLVCLLSLDGIILRVSTSSSSLLCDSPQLRADQLVGLNIAHVIHVNDLPAFYDQLNLAVNEGKISTLAHLLRRKNPPNRDYVGVESTLSLYSFENAPVGESPCILMLSKLTEATEPFPSEENALVSSKNDSQSSRLLLDLRNEAEQLKKQLASLQEELEALRQERNGLPGTKKKKKRQFLDLTCEECGTTESPEWRKGPSGTQSLCNACGLRHSKRVKKLAQFAGERS